MKKILIVCLSLLLCSLFLINTNSVFASEQTVIEAFAHYEFEDVNNYGKDSSKHGFDLKKVNTSINNDAIQLLVDENDDDGYVSIRRDQDENGVTKGSGAYLYAPQQGNSSYDFSDMITGSYTFSMKFRSDNTIGEGDVYAISFGRYNSCLTVVPWKNGLSIQLNNIEFAEGTSLEEKQEYCAQQLYEISCSTLEWIDLSITADSDTNESCVYINGELIYKETLKDVKLTSSGMEDYTFAIGAQCNIYGASAQQFGNVDIKDLVIYDCCLSAENILNVIFGQDAVLEKQPTDIIYVKSVETLNPATIDLEITDVNTFDSIMENSLPEKVKVTLSNNVDRSYPVYWFVGQDQTIRGYVQCGFVNPSLSEIELQYEYVAKFEYDDKLVTISDIKLDGAEYVPGTPITSAKHMIYFKLEVAEGAVVNSVSCLGMDWEAEDDGTYYIDIAEGGLIVIDAEKESYTVTYMDGSEKLSISKYTEGGSEYLKEFTKDGYTFVGWYLDAALTEEFTGLDYENPSNIVLYAKWQPLSNGKTSDDKSNNTVIIVLAIGGSVLVLGGIVTYILIKKKKKN